MTGLTPAGVAGLLMQRYMHTIRCRAIFEPPSSRMPGNAMFRKAIKPEAYEAEMISDPIGLFDMALADNCRGGFDAV